MSDTPNIDPLKGKNVQIIQAKGKPGGQPGNKNALKHGFRGFCVPERHVLCAREG